MSNTAAQLLIEARQRAGLTRRALARVLVLVLRAMLERSEKIAGRVSSATSPVG